MSLRRRKKAREHLLKKMLREFCKGRTKSCYCIAAPVKSTGELEEALIARKNTDELNLKEKSRILNSLLDEIAWQRNNHLKLRK